MEKKNQKTSFYRVMAYFIIYSFAGFVIETLFALINYNVLESRKSFLYGPFCGIYGVGAVTLILLLKFFNKNNYTLFFGGAVIGSTVEYTMSFLGEKLFDARWWDYSKRFLNINGRTCLLYSIFWGILSLILMRMINPVVDKFIDWVKKKVKIELLRAITSVAMIFLMADAILSGIAVNLFLNRIAVENKINVKNMDKAIVKYMKINENPKLADTINKLWSNEKMVKTFPNIKLTTAEGKTILVKELFPEIKPYIYKFQEE